MGLAGHKILRGSVAHKRLFPKVNGFAYKIYYLALDLAALDTLPIAYNRFGLASFYDRDHGACDGSNLETWARGILADYGVKAEGRITLVCMPRVLGYVFNPVSFWLCHDKKGGLRGVICEVHNTFGERHSYLCAHEDGRVIAAKDVLNAEKLFHVSPFLEREGHYTFRFDISDKRMAYYIDFYNGDGAKQLVTSLSGSLEDLTRTSMQRAFWYTPLVTFKAIFLIHYQAVKLVFKGIRYISKPLQKKSKLSATTGLSDT